MKVAEDEEITICDELAGEYPKSFKWMGWYPQCRCNAVPILKTVDEKIADNLAKRNGQAPAKESVNSVKRLPKAFNEWVERNRDRIAAAKSQPYFIRDNAVEVGKIIPGVLPETMMPATPVIPIAERAQMRHDARTPEQIADIRRRWTLHEANLRHEARTPEQVPEIQAAWNESRRIGGMILEMPSNLTYDEKIAIARNNIEIEKAIGIRKGKPMSVEDADKQNANPNYNKSDEYKINCQTCVPAYNLRLRGFEITAKPNTKGSTLEYLMNGENTWKVWKNQDGTQAQHTSTRLWQESKGYKLMNEKRYLEFFNEVCKEVGVYELCIGWKNGKGGHALILQRFENGELRYIDPQHDNSVGSGNEWQDIRYLAKNGHPRTHISRGLMRIDNKLFDSRFIDIFSK